MFAGIVREARAEESHKAVAAALATGEQRAIWLGALAIRHPSYADLRALAAFHHAMRPDLVVAATRVDDASRYGTLEFDATSRRLSAFREKRPAPGYINAGTYVVNARKLLGFALPVKFSFEQDFLAERVDALDIRVFPEVTAFIDIGVPADYRRAQTVIPSMLETGTSEA